MGPDLGSWQSPDISRSHLYRGTIAWTPPTAIYRAYTVSCSRSYFIGHYLCCFKKYWYIDMAGMTVSQCSNIVVFNSLVCGRPGYEFQNVSLIGFFRFYENALRWMPQDLTDYKSTLVQVMAWCCQAPSHYLSQCWPKSMLLLGHNE